MKPKPIYIKLLAKNDTIQFWHRCISLKYNFYISLVKKCSFRTIFGTKVVANGKYLLSLHHKL